MLGGGCRFARLWRQAPSRPAGRHALGESPRAARCHGSPLASAAEDTIRIGWTIPEEAKYGIMRRSARFANLGKTYKAEFTQSQGTAPVVQAMIAGALDCSTQASLSLANGVIEADLKAIIFADVGERPGNISVYWAVKHDAPIRSIADMKGKSVGTNAFASGILGPSFLLLKRHGLGPQRNITAAVGADLTCCAMV